MQPSLPDSDDASATEHGGDGAAAPHWPVTDEAIRDVFASMLADGSWGRYHGPHCHALELALQEFHDCRHVVLCCSGTAAVELALRSVPVQSGDEVILSAYDFKANFINVLATGAVPVLIDTLPGLPVPDIVQLELACSSRSRAIVVSHLHGSLAPIAEVCELAKSRGIAVIEDACQAPGAIISGRRAGTIGDIGVLSFGGSKLLTSGRGGAIVTNNSAMAQRIRLYTQRGNDAYPLSEMQAAVLLPQLRQLDQRNAVRRARVAEIMQTLNSSVTFRPAVGLPPAGTWNDCHPVFYKLAILLPLCDETRRKELTHTARSEGIPFDPGFHALHLIHSRRRFRAIGELPQATLLHRQLAVLHHTVLSQSETEVQRLIRRLVELRV